MNKKIGKWLTILSYTCASIALILFILPPILGIFAENKCQQMVTIINTTTPFEIKIINYQRGWFKAQAQAQISLNKLKLPNPELYQFTINAEVIHGPLFIDWQKFYLVQALINADVSLNSTQIQWLGLNANSPNIANMRLRFKPNGYAKFTLNSPPLDIHNQDNHLVWKGMQISSTISPQHTHIDSTINIAGLEIATKNFIFHLGTLKSMYRGQKTSQTIWLGERDIRLKTFAITNNNNRIISCDDLHLHTQTNGDNEDPITLTTAVNLSNLHINDTTYNNSQLELEITNIRQAMLAKLYEQLFTNSSPFFLNGNLLDMFLTLASSGSKITVKQFNLDTPWGNLLTNLIITFAQQSNSGLLATIFNSTVNATFQAERTLFLHILEKFYQNINTKPTDNPQKQAATLLHEWEQTDKILQINGDKHLHLNLNYHDHQLLINDKQLSLITKS